MINRDVLTNLTEDDVVERLEDTKMLLTQFAGEHEDYHHFATDAEEALEALIDHLNHHAPYEAGR